MLKGKCDFKSRFRIIKGGKISLMVSALALGSLVNIANATTIEVTSNLTTSVQIDGTNDVNVIENFVWLKSGVTLYFDSQSSIGIQIDNSSYGKIINDGTLSSDYNSNNVIKGISTSNNLTSEIINRNTINISSIRNNGTLIGVYTEKTKNASVFNGSDGNIFVTSNGEYQGVYGVRSNEGNSANKINIENVGTISATGFGAYGIYVNSFYGYIENSGDIIVSAKSSNNAGIYVSDLISGKITNIGNITVNTQTGTASAIYIDTITNPTSYLTNNGVIKATVENEYTNAAYSINSPYALNFNVINKENGELRGNINLRGELTNNGLISLPYNATNTTIGTFINSATGILEIGLLTDGTTTTYSQLSSNYATFENGSTIKINVLSSSTNVDLIAGATLNDVVSASDLLTINGTLNVTDNSALLNFNYVKDGNTVDLKAIQAQTIEEAVNNANNTNEEPGNNANNTNEEYLTRTNAGKGRTPTQNAAKAFDKVQNAGTYTSMNSVFTSLNRLSTDAQVAQAVESTTPQTGTANLNATTQISNNIQGIVDTRQNINMSGGLNSGDDMFADKNFWIKAFGSRGEQDDKNGINGFDLEAKGFGLGIDGEKNDKQIGAAFFYTNANVDVNNVSQSSNLDVFTALVYGNVPVIDDKTKLLYQASYSWQQNSSSRDIAFMGTTASADYTTTIAAADLKLVRDYRITNSFMVQPLIQTTYRYFDSPSYNETGAGALNLHVNSFNSNQLLAGGGLIAHYKLDDDSKIIGNISALYDVNNKKQTVTSSYEGAVGVEFETDGIDNGRWQYETGIAYERNITKGSNVNFGYNYQEQGSFDNHTLSAKYVYTF
jgi:outer membrane autotransporter protein